MEPISQGLESASRQLESLRVIGGVEQLDDGEVAPRLRGEETELLVVPVHVPAEGPSPPRDGRREDFQLPGHWTLAGALPASAWSWVSRLTAASTSFSPDPAAQRALSGS